MKYLFTPEALKELLKLLYDASLAHPDNRSSVDFPKAELYYDGTFSVIQADQLFEGEHTELFLDM